MANHWAITIGINQYRHLQPLMHAQNDARSLYQFLTEESGVPADRCVLLSDLATSVSQQAVYPDKTAVTEWIHTITQQVNAGDVLWVFFSGYGSQLAEADYLMPIDGDPGQIESTGIAVADLIESLSRLPTQRILLILDINRSQGALPGQTIGTQMIDLAQKYQVGALLSCQPEQYSHETFGVRNGLFTTALLEALTQNCATFGQISDYLSERLPELCEHHWRPIQNPASVIPDEQKFALIVPSSSETGALNQATPDQVAAGFAAATAAATIESRADRAADAMGSTTDFSADAANGAAADALLVEPLPKPPDHEAAYSSEPGPELDSGNAYSQEPYIEGDYSQERYSQESYSQEPYSQEPAALETYRVADNSSVNSSAIVPYQASSDSAISGAKLRNWGLLALAILMGGVLLKQPFVKTAWQDLSDRVSAAIAPANSPDDPAAPLADNAAGSATATDELPETAVSPTSQTGQTTEAATPAAANATPTTASTADEANATNGEADSAAAQATAKTLIAQANAAIAQKQYSEALITLQKVPRNQRDSSFSAVLIKARTGSAETEQANASVLTEARTAIQPIQASQFTEAIAKARLIKSGQPSYEEAQNDIRNWSQIILDIAEGRATSGNLESAIAAARVMPYDNAEFYKKAQDRIAFWQQRQRSRQIMLEAQTIPKLGQANTYQKGIVKLREVPIEHPEYEAAQRLADEWSDRIFSIAQARAAQGRQDAAVQAAILVPAGTTAYEPAQQAIRRWQTAE